MIFPEHVKRSSSFFSLFFSPELRSCVKAEVAVLGYPPLISLIVSVDVKLPSAKVSGIRT